MQPMQTVIQYLRSMTNRSQRLFSLEDLRALLPGHRAGAFKSVISRLEKRGELKRVCRGIYILPDTRVRGDELLARVAVRLRPHHFNYLSLETVLSDEGVISQIPMNRITVMSSGRSNTISCGIYGSVEFVHTQKTPTDLAAHLDYDTRLGMWRASAKQALADMRDTRRDTGLGHWEMVDESI